MSQITEYEVGNYDGILVQQSESVTLPLSKSTILTSQASGPSDVISSEKELDVIAFRSSTESMDTVSLKSKYGYCIA